MTIYPEEFLNFAQSITNKRAKIVIDHILKYGFITTEDLEKTYEYNHPPRAARDVREAGIPLETFKIKSTDGKSIAAYRFGDLTKIRHDRIQGRKVFSKTFKQSLYKGYCYICNGKFEARYLQIDHKVPYEINADDTGFQQNASDYMLLCSSCNRAKSWSCEHCLNWNETKQSDICLICYWGNPENYEHITLEKIRRLELTWQGAEIEFFEKLKKEAEKKESPLSDYVKSLISKCGGNKK